MLFDACRSKNPERQEEGYRRLERAIYPVIYLRSYNRRDGAEFAADCLQQTLERVYNRIEDCHSPDSFIAWARRIGINITLNAIKRHSRIEPFDEEEEQERSARLVAPQPLPDQQLEAAQLWQQLEADAPISARSKRVVLGRFRDQLPDESLALHEGVLADQVVLPSHIQVTRSKNLQKLRGWQRLQSYR